MRLQQEDEPKAQANADDWEEEKGDMDEYYEYQGQDDEDGEDYDQDYSESSDEYGDDEELFPGALAEHFSKEQRVDVQKALDEGLDDRELLASTSAASANTIDHHL